LRKAAALRAFLCGLSSARIAISVAMHTAIGLFDIRKVFHGFGAGGWRLSRLCPSPPPLLVLPAFTEALRLFHS